MYRTPYQINTDVENLSCKYNLINVVVDDDDDVDVEDYEEVEQLKDDSPR